MTVHLRSTIIFLFVEHHQSLLPAHSRIRSKIVVYFNQAVSESSNYCTWQLVSTCNYGMLVYWDTVLENFEMRSHSVNCKMGYSKSCAGRYERAVSCLLSCLFVISTLSYIATMICGYTRKGLLLPTRPEWSAFSDSLRLRQRWMKWLHLSQGDSVSI